jgi:hypothetical protein
VREWLWISQLRNEVLVCVCSRSILSRLRLATLSRTNVCFSNRPFGVKHFQTIHRTSVDVARGLALLFGIGTRALPAWGSKTRWNNLLGGLAFRLMAGPSRHANSPHPSSREGHHSTRWWSSSFLLSGLIRLCFHAAAVSLVQRNSVPSTQTRCMITARRRASATIAFFIPRCLAIFIAQAWVATRYDKLAANYLAFVQLASIRLWLRVNESTS